MNFPITHPVWMWLYFGAFGSTGAILFTIIVWHWRKIHALSKGHQRSVARWSMAGYMFLFFAMWFACGIGGPPGNMLSSDPVTQNLSYAITAGVLSIFFSVPGWACVLVSQRKTLRDIQSDKIK